VRYSSLTRRIDVGGAGAWHVHALAGERVAAGEDVIVLSIGDPDFAPPAAVVEAAVAGLRGGRTHYTPTRGDPALLDAIAERASADAGRPVAPERVVFFPGAQAALFAVCLCLLEPGDEVVVPEPAYATYEGLLAATGATTVHVPLHPERGFGLDPAEVEQRVGARTRAVLVNTPHNPTGAAIAADDLERLARTCASRGCWLVSDEVYGALMFERPHASALALAGAEERVAVVSSLSKSHAMTGFRAGWAVVPSELADHLDRLLQSMLFGCPPFVQDAALAALRAGSVESGRMREAYRRRARLVVDALAPLAGVSCRMPDAGMFVLLDVRACGLDADAFAERLLAEAGVSLLPIASFGPSGAGHVRLGLAAPDERLAEACTRIAAFVRRLP
jgi:arginine:pyruvate transaminase